MPPFHIRRITEINDVEPCDMLFHEYFDWLVTQLRECHQIVLSPKETEEIHADFRAEYPSLLGDRGRMVLLLVDDQPAGVGTLKPISEEDVEVKRMYVRPEFRGNKFGKILFDHLIGEAKSLGYRMMRLETFHFMVAAVRMYRSHGFKEVECFEGFEGGDHGTSSVELFMTLDLL